MVESRTDITWATDDPRTFAYRIREALNFAVKNNIEKYAALKGKFKILERPGEVTAKLRFQLPIDILKQSHSRIVIPDLTTPLEIIGATIEHQGHIEIHFPDSRFSDVELTKIYNWSTRNDFKMIYSSMNGLTFTKKAISEEMVWHPKALHTPNVSS